MEDHGDIPDHVSKRLKETKDKDILRKWHKLAANSNSIEEFEAALHYEKV